MTTVEVAHEAILRRWPDLAGWIDSERDFLVGKGRLDQVIKDFPRDKALVSEPLLGRARQWLIDHPDRFGSHERAFIRRSQQAAEHETARKLRLQRALTWGSAAAALVFAIIGGFALWQWDEATQARIAATAASEQATASKNAALRAQALAMREEAIARDARENAERAVVTAVNSATGLIDRLEGDLRDKDTPPKYFQDAVENTGSLLDKLFGIFPQHGAVHEALLANQQKLGDIQMQLGRYREARRIYEKAKAIAVAIADTVGTDKPHILGLAAFYEEKAAAAEKARPQLTIVVFAGDARTWPVRQVTRSVARHAGKEGDAAPAPAEVPRSLAFTKAR